MSYDEPPDYDSIRQRPDWMARIRKALGPVVAVVIALAKFSFVLLKFSSIFIAVAAYALIFGWKFAVGFVALIFVHEAGHYIEAKREGLSPKLPVARHSEPLTRVASMPITSSPASVT